MGVHTVVTLKVLAEELGLNASTVSRVLNDPTGIDSRWASQDTKERIFALAEERGYRKNPYAASLRTAKSQMVGVVVPRLQDYVLATIYEGIDEAATEHGYFTVVSNSLDDPEAHRAKAEKLLDRRADGLILGDATFEDPYLDELAERDVIRNGTDVWLYDSKANEATHLVLPDADPLPAPDGTPPTPPELAERLLAELNPSTEVTVDSGDQVAGRPVYELVLTPRTDVTLVGDVTVAVDSETGLPLAVSVDPRGSEQDAFTVEFTSVDFGTPDADLFVFTPPEGASVQEGVPPQESSMPSMHAMPTPLVTGTGWDSVVELPADVLASADPEQQALITQLTTAVPEGRALQTRILTMLLTSDGRVLAGAVSLEALQAAAR